MTARLRTGTPIIRYRPSGAPTGPTFAPCDPGFETDYSGPAYSAGTEIPIISNGVFYWRDESPADVTCWANFAVVPAEGPTWYQDTAAPRAGTFHAAIDLDADDHGLAQVGEYVDLDAGFPPWYYYAMPVTPGQTVQIGVYARLDTTIGAANDEAIRFALYFNDATASYVDEAVSTFFDVDTTTYTEHTFSAVVPTGAALLDAVIIAGASTGSRTIYVDDFTLTAS